MIYSTRAKTQFFKLFNHIICSNYFFHALMSYSFTFFVLLWNAIFGMLLSIVDYVTTQHIGTAIINQKAPQGGCSQRRQHARFH